MVPLSPEQSGEKTARQLHKEQGKLTSDTVAARIGDALVDLHSLVPDSGELTSVAGDDPDALRVIRHSASHIMDDARILKNAGIGAVSDFSSDKLGAKIRNAGNMRYPFIAVVGQKEAEQKGVTVRSRDQNKDLGFMSLDALIDMIQREGIPSSMRNN
jgi:threonyl-tRNA synthetase